MGKPAAVQQDSLPEIWRFLESELLGFVKEMYTHMCSGDVFQCLEGYF